MPKQLVIESTLVNYGDDRGGVHHDRGEIIDVPKDVARTLVNAGRTLYVEKADDVDKNGRNTASKEMLKAAANMAKAKPGEQTEQPAA